VLSGGRSRRFGTNKAFAIYDGEPFLTRVLVVMRRVFRQVFIVANEPERFGGLAVPVVRDILSHQGPVGGIVTALHHVRSPGIFAVACDMPLITEVAIRHLLGEDDGSPLVAYHHGERGIEPLCAIYRQPLTAVLVDRIASGRRDLRGLVSLDRRARAVDLPPEHRRALVNINTPGDYDALLAIAGSIR
jgi:molybdopterin-guanine dinucleotide biosynthesis protein A